MARSYVRNDGKIGKKSKFQSVTTKSLVKLEGGQEVIDGIEARLANLKAEIIKESFVKAALPAYGAVLQNINALPVGNKLKEVLRPQVSISRGEDRKPNVLLGMSQGAGTKRLPDRFIVNPYWVEFGTAERSTKGGRRTGRFSATPYFRPAITASKGAIRQALVSELKALLIEE
jgi:hypothetical protein